MIFLMESCVWNRINLVQFMQFVPLVPFEVAHFKEPISSSILSPHSYVILHAGLARSCRIHCFKKRKISFTLGRRSPLSTRARVNFWMMDSATSPFGSAQNDRVGGTLRRLKFFGLNKPTKRKSGAMCMSWSLMQCVMTYYLTESIGFWLKHVFNI